MWKNTVGIFYCTTYFFVLNFKFVVLLATGALTCTFVELARLCNVPFAEFGPLSNSWSFATDVITGQDRVQEDAPETGQTGRSAGRTRS